FAPFGEQCTCSAVNKKELECIKETISKYCAKFTRKEAILTPPAHFNKTSITSDCWQILFFSPDHFNN
ncbi:protein YhaB, partial [Shigella flexneri]